MNTNNGNFVLDNELIFFRAKDLEGKVLSHRKTGKEGRVADCFVDSILDILYGMRLKYDGELQKGNVSKFMKIIPPITQLGHHPVFACSRG